MIVAENKKKIHDKLYEICKDCHCQHPHDPFCTLIEILTYTTRDQRYLVQIKCIEKFQYTRASETLSEISMARATELWINEGWAELFAKHYKDDMLIETLFHNILNDRHNLIPNSIQL